MRRFLLRLLFLSGAMVLAVPTRAGEATNAFVVIRAEGAGRVNGRDFRAKDGTRGEIEVLPGWKLLTPPTVRAGAGGGPLYRVRSYSGEEQVSGDVLRTVVVVETNHWEGSEGPSLPEISASVNTGGPWVYAAPDNGVRASVAFDAGFQQGKRNYRRLSSFLSIRGHD